MAVQKMRFWTRVGHWLKGSGRPVNYEVEDPATGPLESRASPNPSIQDGVQTPLTEDRSSPVTKLRLSRSGPGLERLEEEYARVVKLIDAVQEHLASQADRSEMMARSLERLAESLAFVPEASRRQLELLSAISETVAADAACAKRVEESLSQLPGIADAQRETMVSIGRQLDSSRQTSDRIATTTDSLQQAVTRLGEATDASAKVTEEMHRDTRSNDQRVATLLQEQSKRFALFAWSAVGLAAVAAALGLFALLR